ncbi:MAG: diguanylate cyclase, partial [Betaproteobacteria bacterium]|nr:diguanylate cyclase [Betaproteobacteria bacterium]
AAPVGEAGALALLRETLDDILAAVATRIPADAAELASEFAALRERLRSASSVAQIAEQRPKLRALAARIAERSGEGESLAPGLFSLVRIMVDNIEALVPEGGWVRGQVERLRGVLSAPLDAATLADAECSLREVVSRQRAMRRELEQASAALREMLGVFLDQLGSTASSTGGFEKRLEGYAARVRGAADIAELSDAVGSMLEDARGMREQMGRVRDELNDARERAARHEARVRELEGELIEVSDKVRQDPLTGVLNRRGFTDAFDAEASRGDRSGRAMCIGLLDIDNFKKLNDTHGHLAGDRALQHLAAIVRESLRPSDSVARYGGEEFVILLPETALGEGVAAMTRLQRQLTRKFFLHENERLLITFSAGVAERRSGETQADVMARADAKLYEAKRSGKNRVLAAEG